MLKNHMNLKNKFGIGFDVHRLVREENSIWEA